MKLRILYLSLMSLLLFNCSSDSDSVDEDIDNDELVGDGTTDDGTTDELITYDKDVAPIISTYCLKCHGSPTANGAPSGAVFDTHEAITNSIIRGEIFDWPGFMLERMNGREGGIMPPSSEGGRLDQKLIDTVAQWIEDGLLEN